MKTILEPADLDELLDRLARLGPDSERQWGQMSAAQMMEHTARALDMAMGKKPMKQLFLGKMVSWMFRKEFLGEKPFKPGRPTGKNFIITDEPDFESTRSRLIELLNEFHEMGEAKLEGNIHGFFGRLTGKQWGETQYKHVDHHLRQFGV